VPQLTHGGAPEGHLGVEFQALVLVPPAFGPAVEGDDELDPAVLMAFTIILDLLLEAHLALHAAVLLNRKLALLLVVILAFEDDELVVAVEIDVEVADLGFLELEDLNLQ
jgi:hypothetical protein